VFNMGFRRHRWRIGMNQKMECPIYGQPGSCSILEGCGSQMALNHKLLLLLIQIKATTMFIGSSIEIYIYITSG
jgi:hypothetical protein